MNEEKEVLLLRDNAARQLQEITDIETGKNYLKKMNALKIWVTAEKKDDKLLNIIAEQKIRTQRILGILIKQGQEKGEIASKGENKYNNLIKEGEKKTLPELGITPRLSSQFKIIANMSEEAFESLLKNAQERVELTTIRVCSAAKRMDEIKKISGEAYSNPKLAEIDKLLLKAGDQLQCLIQKDENYLPKSPKDYAYLDSIKHHMDRLVKMAGQLLL